MDFFAILDQVMDLLRRRGRITYRALQLQFRLDETSLAVLKEELIKAQRLPTDENHEVLVWVGGVGSIPAPARRAAAAGHRRGRCKAVPHVVPCPGAAGMRVLGLYMTLRR
jgi:hypothetical protein